MFRGAEHATERSKEPTAPSPSQLEYGPERPNIGTRRGRLPGTGLLLGRLWRQTRFRLGKEPVHIRTGRGQARQLLDSQHTQAETEDRLMVICLV